MVAVHTAAGWSGGSCGAAYTGARCSSRCATRATLSRRFATFRTAASDGGGGTSGGGEGAGSTFTVATTEGDGARRRTDGLAGVGVVEVHTPEVDGAPALAAEEEGQVGPYQHILEMSCQCAYCIVLVQLNNCWQHTSSF